MIKNSKLDFNKEFIVKISLKKKLITDFCCSIISMIILYICLTHFNDEIVSIFSGVNNNYTAMTVVLIFFPIFLIVKICITLSEYIIFDVKK